MATDMFELLRKAMAGGATGESEAKTWTFRVPDCTCPEGAPGHYSDCPEWRDMFAAPFTIEAGDPE